MSEQRGPRCKWGKCVFGGVVLVLVAVLVVQLYLLVRPGGSRVRRPAEAQAAMREGPEEIETFGDPGAPVKIRFYAPLALPWHQETIGLLRDYDASHPGRIHVTLLPMGLEEADVEMGHSCAKILINGQNEFTLPDGQEVVLEKQPNTSMSSYNSEDVITIIEQLVAAQ